LGGKHAPDEILWDQCSLFSVDEMAFGELGDTTDSSRRGEYSCVRKR
jgi:hypothetical protein